MEICGAILVDNFGGFLEEIQKTNSACNPVVLHRDGQQALANDVIEQISSRRVGGNERRLHQDVQNPTVEVPLGARRGSGTEEETRRDITITIKTTIITLAGSGREKGDTIANRCATGTGPGF